MLWEIRVKYANGREQVLHSFQKHESAIRGVDMLYSKHGYPMHMAYVVRPARLSHAA
jgi:hypothetical protein